MIPADWFIAELMQFLDLPYYVGVLSAAALHGAAHQQAQEFHVVVPRCHFKEFDFSRWAAKKARMKILSSTLLVALACAGCATRKATPAPRPQYVPPQSHTVKAPAHPRSNPSQRFSDTTFVITDPKGKKRAATQDENRFLREAARQLFR